MCVYDVSQILVVVVEHTVHILSMIIVCMNLYVMYVQSYECTVSCMYVKLHVCHVCTATHTFIHDIHTWYIHIHTYIHTYIHTSTYMSTHIVHVYMTCMIHVLHDVCVHSCLTYYMS